jgi:predicted ATPase
VAPPGEDDALLERTGELATLARSLATARDGRGSFVLVSGEAGVGKTALVRAFCEAHRGAARVPFLGRAELVAFIEDTAARWFKQPMPATAEVSVSRPDR